MIKITANGVCARAQRLEPLTSGMVGAKVAFELSPDFDGLTVTAVFTNGAVTKDVLNPGDECFIPPEVLEIAGKTVKVGIYAVRGSELVIPTVYAPIGVVLPGADPSGDTSTSATLPIWAQIEAMIGSLDDLTTEAKNNLVAAINEAAQSGGGSASIAMRVDGGYIQYSTDNGKTWVNLIAESDLEGDTGPQGPAGADGKSAYQYAVDGGYTGTETEFAEKLASGALIVTITESNGTLSADKSYIEIKDAILAGIPVLVDYNDDTLPFIEIDSGLYFGTFYCDDGVAELIVSTTMIEILPNGEVNDISSYVEALPNPYALTFTGAVTGRYDGSAPMTVNIPEGGGGDGGTGAKEFHLVRSITLEEQLDRVDISVDSSGNAFALHEVYVMIAAQSYGNAENVNFLPNGRWGSGDAFIVSTNKTSASTDTWKNDMIFHAVYADGIICSEQLPAKGQNNTLTSKFATNQTIITKISIVSKFAAGCTFLVIGR